MGANNEGLFYIGGLGRSGNEYAEGIRVPLKPLVSLVQIIYDLIGWHDQNQMLCDDEDGPVWIQRFAGDPHGGVFGYSERAWNDGYLDAFEVVRILNRAQIDIP